MSRGYVYVLTNPSMPGLVKIGRTVRDVDARALELFQTGVPTPFVVERTFFCVDCFKTEREAHAALADYRVNIGREFFAVTVARAESVISEIAMCDLLELIHECAPGMTLVSEYLVVDEAGATLKANDLDARLYEVPAAYDELTAEELRPALYRHREKFARRMEARRSVQSGGGSLQ